MTLNSFFLFSLIGLLIKILLLEKYICQLSFCLKKLIYILVNLRKVFLKITFILNLDNENIFLKQ